MSPSVASSPVIPTFPDPKVPPRSSPAPANPARPSSSRARQNSTQANNAENGPKARPQTVVAPVKANGSVPNTPDVAAPTSWPKTVNEPKVTKEAKEVTKHETKEAEPAETVSAPPPPPPPTASKKEVVKTEEPDRRPEPTPIQTTTITTVTKSGRASKPSTPALATFQDAARSRSSRNSETASAPKRSNNKKSSSTAQLVAAHVADEDGNSSAPGDEDEAEADDPNEPTFCYCNRVSFGEMIACDAEGCEKEWFHLSCVGMRVAPKSNIKWYCDICKERMKAGVKKPNGR